MAGGQARQPASQFSCALSGLWPPGVWGDPWPMLGRVRSPSNFAHLRVPLIPDAELPQRYEAARPCPGDILRCSLPHLIALPCQTRAERAKAPSPVPRSISWQSFESNCDCSALRASASEKEGKQPSKQAIVVPAYRNCLVSLLWQPCLERVCPAPAWPCLSLLSSPTSSRDFSLAQSHTHSLSLSLSLPRSDHP